MKLKPRDAVTVPWGEAMVKGQVKSVRYIEVGLFVTVFLPRTEKIGTVLRPADIGEAMVTMVPGFGQGVLWEYHADEVNPSPPVLTRTPWSFDPLW